MRAFLTIPETCVWAATRRPEAVDALTERAREGIHTLLDPEGGDDAAWKAFKALEDLCAAGELTMYGIGHGAGVSAPSRPMPGRSSRLSRLRDGDLLQHVAAEGC